MARTRRGAGVLATVLLLAGCGAVGDEAGGGAASVVPVVSPRMACSPWAASGRSMPAGATPTAVLRCDTRRELVRGDGEWLIEVRERATDVGALVAALNLPSLPRTDDPCSMEGRGPLSVLVEVGGSTLLVASPTDACGKVRLEVEAAFTALHWTEVSRRPLRRERSEAAVAGGCDVQSDELATSAAYADPDGPGPVLAPSAETHVCRYRSVYPRGWSRWDWTRQNRSGPAVDGEPQSGFRASESQVAEIGAKLAAAWPAAPCEAVHTSFAVIRQGETSLTFVELDGCHRILAPDGTLRQGDAELARLLTTT
jgi:hypothetical protein